MLVVSPFNTFSLQFFASCYRPGCRSTNSPPGSHINAVVARSSTIIEKEGKSTTCYQASATAASGRGADSPLAKFVAGHKLVCPTRDRGNKMYHTSATATAAAQSIHASEHERSPEHESQRMERRKLRQRRLRRCHLAPLPFLPWPHESKSCARRACAGIPTEIRQQRSPGAASSHGSHVFRLVSRPYPGRRGRGTCFMIIFIWLGHSIASAQRRRRRRLRGIASWPGAADVSAAAASPTVRALETAAGDAGGRREECRRNRRVNADSSAAAASLLLRLPMLLVPRRQVRPLRRGLRLEVVQQRPWGATGVGSRRRQRRQVAATLLFPAWRRPPSAAAHLRRLPLHHDILLLRLVWWLTAVLLLRAAEPGLQAAGGGVAPRAAAVPAALGGPEFAALAAEGRERAERG